MAWTILLTPSAIKDLDWLGKNQGRQLLRLVETILDHDPAMESSVFITLAPNGLVQRELRIAGKFRVLFNVHEEKEKATLLAIGEQRGRTMLIQGKEYGLGHENRSLE